MTLDPNTSFAAITWVLCYFVLIVKSNEYPMLQLVRINPANESLSLYFLRTSFSLTLIGQIFKILI
jgi:hypothetical protein